MKQKFLKDWDSTKEIPNYPPEYGRTSLFSSRSVVEHFSFAVVSYYQIENETFALFSYDTEIQKPALLFKEFQDDGNIPPLKFCIDRIASVTQENGTIVFDVREFTDCYNLRFTNAQISEIQNNPINILKYMNLQNVTLKDEDVLVISKATLSFNLRTIHFSNIPSKQNPICHLIELKITYDNTEHSGEVFVELNTDISSTKTCNLKVHSGLSKSVLLRTPE
uniref:Uncharacterized protein n=1 Tax=Panagrolaimus sp. PS1159 TaxID=55785 RepID=A0AC35GRE5_9BILA